MNKNRLEAFSDGIMAIIITIMVLETSVPHGVQWSDLLNLIPKFMSYTLSFVFIGIYWNNHHHLIHTVHKINGTVLWANLNLLFWLSLIPFSTAWMGENHFAKIPVALYGCVLLASAIAFTILTRLLIANQGSESILAKAIGNDVKGKLSLGIYIAAIPLSFVSPWISLSLYTIVSIIWLIPDLRIEKFYK